MKTLKIGEVVRFSAIDDFTGQKMELIGKVIGDHRAVKHAYPEECAEVEAGFYLVSVGNRSHFVIGTDEVLEII